MNKSEKARLWYGIFLSVMTVATGIVFIAQTAVVYYSAPSAQFAVDNLSKYLTLPLCFLAVWVAAIICGFILSVIYPTKKSKAKEDLFAARLTRRILWGVSGAVLLAAVIIGLVYIFNPTDPTLPMCMIAAWVVTALVAAIYTLINPPKKRGNEENALELLKRRIPESGDENFQAAKAKFNKLDIARRCIWAATLVLMAIPAIFVMVYAFNPSNYGGNPQSVLPNWKYDILMLVRHTIIWVGVGFVLAIAATIADVAIVKKQIDLAKKAIASGDKSSAKTANGKSVKNGFVLFCSIASGAIILCAIVLFAVAPTVLYKLLNTQNPSVLIPVIAILTVILIVVGIATMKYIRKYVPQKVNDIMLICTRVAVGVIAVAFIIAGALNGGADDVLIKAIAICQECVGIG